MNGSVSLFPVSPFPSFHVTVSREQEITFEHIMLFGEQCSIRDSGLPIRVEQAGMQMGN